MGAVGFWPWVPPGAEPGGAAAGCGGLPDVAEDWRIGDVPVVPGDVPLDAELAVAAAAGWAARAEPKLGTDDCEALANGAPAGCGAAEDGGDGATGEDCKADGALAGRVEASGGGDEEDSVEGLVAVAAEAVAGGAGEADGDVVCAGPAPPSRCVNPGGFGKDAAPAVVGKGSPGLLGWPGVAGWVMAPGCDFGVSVPGLA